MELVATGRGARTAAGAGAIRTLNGDLVRRALQHPAFADQVPAVSLRLDDRAVVFDGPGLRPGGARFALDRTLSTWEQAGVRASLRLLSVAGNSDGYRVCWELVADTIGRTSCSVHSVAASIGSIVDMTGGEAVRYPRAFRGASPLLRYRASCTA